MTPTETRRKAADLIEEQGWIQNRNRSAAGFCLIAALSAVSPSSAEWLAATGEMYRVLDGPLTNWNDALGRTKAEVLAALRGQS